jgi:hypothetical protein
VVSLFPLNFYLIPVFISWQRLLSFGAESFVFQFSIQKFKDQDI